MILMKQGSIPDLMHRDKVLRALDVMVDRDCSVLLLRDGICEVVSRAGWTEVHSGA